MKCEQILKLLERPHALFFEEHQPVKGYDKVMMYLDKIYFLIS